MHKVIISCTPNANVATRLSIGVACVFTATATAAERLHRDDDVDKEAPAIHLMLL